MSMMLVSNRFNRLQLMLDTRDAKYNVSFPALFRRTPGRVREAGVFRRLKTFGSRRAVRVFPGEALACQLRGPGRNRHPVS